MLNRRGFLRAAASGAAVSVMRPGAPEQVEHVLDEIGPALYLSDPIAKQVADTVMAKANLDPNHVARMTLIGDVWHVLVYKQPVHTSALHGGIASRIVKVPA